MESKLVISSKTTKCRDSHETSHSFDFNVLEKSIDTATYPGISYLAKNTHLFSTHDGKKEPHFTLPKYT